MTKKKREKQRVRIIAYKEYMHIPGLQVEYQYFINGVSYGSSVFVPPGEDIWETIAKELDSEFIALLQQEREV